MSRTAKTGIDWDVRKVIESWKYPSDDLVGICAHRGARHDGGTENSYMAVLRAAEAGIESIEIDVRLTKDGHLVVLHDNGLGRVTNVKPPPGQEEFNPFTGKGYNPLVKDVNWVGDMEFLYLRDGYGNVTDEHPILFHQLLEYIRDNGISIVVTADFKGLDSVRPSFETIMRYQNAKGIPASEWCVLKLRAEWFPSPKEWEAQEYVQQALAEGRQLPPLTPLYEFEDETTIETMKQWAEKDYFVAYEICIARGDGIFSRTMDFVRSERSKYKGTAGWFIGSDLPRGYYSGVQMAWDDSSVREAILAEGPDVPCHLDECNGAIKPGGVFGKPVTLQDQRCFLAWAITLGNSFVITDTHVDVHAELEKLGKRNIHRMLEVAN